MYKDNQHLVVGKTFGIKDKYGKTFGIEIEMEAEPNNALPPGNVTKVFQGKPDGSLRNGIEYVSKPINLGEVETSVDILADVLRSFGARPQPTYRSSTHIHVNYVNRTFREVAGMMVLWSLVEPVVFRMMPPGRDGSLFCVSSYDSGDLTKFMGNFCANTALGWGHGFFGRGKYSSLNTNRLGTCDGDMGLGTLEFRVFPPSLSGRQIKEWCQWLQNLVDIVEKEPDPSFLGLVERAEAQPVKFIRDIFGGVPIADVDLPQWVDFGCRHAYELGRVIREHLEAQPKTKEKKKTVAFGDGLENAFDDVPNDFIPIPEAPEAAANPAEPFPWPAAPPAPRVARPAGAGVRRARRALDRANRAAERDRDHEEALRQMVAWAQNARIRGG